MALVHVNSEVAALWASRAQSSARNGTGSFYFEGDTIYSYGPHFPIARIVQNASGSYAVLITTRSYSATSAGHVYTVWGVALRHFQHVFWVEDPMSGDYQADLKSYRERLEELLWKETRARIHKRYYRSRLDSLEGEARKFHEFFKLDGLPLSRMRVARELHLAW